jgi:hypothetical protein
LQNLFKDKSMRKLIQASLLTLALTASIQAGDIGQPIAPPSNAAAQGDMQNGIIEIGAAILQTVLSLF